MLLFNFQLVLLILGTVPQCIMPEVTKLVNHRRNWWLWLNSMGSIGLYPFKGLGRGEGSNITPRIVLLLGVGEIFYSPASSIGVLGSLGRSLRALDRAPPKMKKTGTSDFKMKKRKCPFLLLLCVWGHREPCRESSDTHDLGAGGWWVENPSPILAAACSWGLRYCFPLPSFIHTYSAPNFPCRSLGSPALCITVLPFILL